MRWSQLTESQPALGAIAHDKLLGPGVVLVGTTRRDGTARISGTEPLVMDGDLWLSMMPTSMKAHDLRRDRRILIHSIVSGPEPAPEIKLRGTVRQETDREVQQRYAEAVRTQIGWEPVVGRFTLLAVDLEDVTYIGYDPATKGQHVARWPAGVEYLRAATSPTSLGPVRPISRLLATRPA